MSIRHQQEKADLLIVAETWEREALVKRALAKIKRQQTLKRGMEDYQAQQAAILKQNTLREDHIPSVLRPRIVNISGKKVGKDGWSISVPDDRMKEAQKLIGGKHVS